VADFTRTTEAAIVFWLHQAHHAVRGDILRLFNEGGHDLTAEQWAILSALWQRDDCSQTELARVAGRDRPGVTRLVDTLEKKKLLLRAEAPRDRRSYRIRLTASGRRLHAVLGRLIEDVVRRALRGMPAKERDALRLGLRHIARNIRNQ
jgi:MarR family transcriptional regulator, organic hydroperoxide resistance regulator